MHRGPKLLGASESGTQKFNARKEYATSEKLKNWGLAEGIESPQVTVKPQGPLRALLCHWA